MFQKAITIKASALGNISKEFEKFFGKSPETLESYDRNSFRDLFIDSLFDVSCINTDIKAVKSDDNYVYFPIDPSWVEVVTGIVSADEIIYECIVLPMFDINHRKNTAESVFLDTEYDYNWKVYIRFEPAKYYDDNLNCFEFAVEIDDKFYCNLSEETDIELMEENNYPFIEYVKEKYKTFLKFAVSQTKRYIRHKLFKGVYGEYLQSSLYDDLFVQQMRQDDIDKNFVVNNYLKRIKKKEEIRWHEVYDNIMAALN